MSSQLYSIFSCKYYDIEASLSAVYDHSIDNVVTIIIAWLLVVVIEFTSRQFVGSESSGFIEVMVGITGGILTVPINITLTPSVQSPLSASGKWISDDYQHLVIHQLLCPYGIRERF